MLALLLAAAQTPSFPIAMYDRVTAATAAKRITDCGAGAATVEPAPELDADVIVVAEVSPISDVQLACIDKAASFYDVQVSPDSQPRLNAFRDARRAAFMAAEGRKWFADRKLLDRLPRYEPGATDDATFTRAIEKLCAASGAFQSRYGFHAISPEWVTAQHTARKDGPFTCLMNAEWVTGYPMSFIGNEAYAPVR